METNKRNFEELYLTLSKKLVGDPNKFCNENVKKLASDFFKALQILCVIFH